MSTTILAGDAASEIGRARSAVKEARERMRREARREARAWTRAHIDGNSAEALAAFARKREAKRAHDRAIRHLAQLEQCPRVEGVLA